MSAFALRLAILPSVLLLLFVVRRNKQNRDPMSLLVWLAVLGAVSTIPAVIVELLGGGLLYYMGLETGSAVYELVDCFFIVAMIEELGKFLGMLILTWKNKNFDHSYDGVIYGVCSSLGFATLENILYVFQGGIGLGILRAVTAIPLHCSCGVIMGYFYSKARENANKGEGAAGNMLIAYFSAMGIHGLYDFVLSIDDTSVILCILVLILSVVLMFLLISHAAKNDHIIAVNPIWVNPYNFRYIPMRDTISQICTGRTCSTISQMYMASGRTTSSQMHTDSQVSTIISRVAMVSDHSTVSRIINRAVMVSRMVTVSGRGSTTSRAATINSQDSTISSQVATVSHSGTVSRMATASRPSMAGSHSRIISIAATVSSHITARHHSMIRRTHTDSNKIFI